MAKHFECDICDKKFSDRYNLSSHMHVHATDTPFACPQCPYRGKTKKYLARHRKKVHTELTGKNKCSVCGKFFLHPSALKVHAMVHSGEKPHKCNVCGKTFRVTYSLNSHMLIHTNEKPFACSFCDYACRDSSTLRKHQNKHMGLEKIYQCKICNKGYKSRAALKIHIAETHLELDMRKFPCTHCDKMFKSNAHRQSHIESIHKRSLVCNCPICGRRLLNRNNLGAHMRTHLDERPFSCTHPGCNTSFKDKVTILNNLGAHMRTHLEERPFSCTHPGCNTSFKDKNSLTKHTVIHYPDMHFPCQYCGRKFARKSHRKQHERVMHVERIKNVECDYCGSKKFARKSHRKQHERVMHVERIKNVECDYCGSKFYTKNYLRKHIQTKHVYKQQFKYICDTCGLVTYNKPGIVMHIKYGHTNENDVQCKICDKKIVYKRHEYLKQHYWKTHNIKYKITRKGFNKAKKEKNSVEVKVEPIEADSYEEIQLMEVQKQENEDIIDESLDYSKSVLSEDIAASVLRGDAHGTEVDFDEFFIKHVFKQEDTTEEKNTDGIDKEQDEYVKRRIKKILKRTEKIMKEKETRRKRKREERERVKREKEEAVAQAKREREELGQLRRVRVLYNERMEKAVAREKQKKEQVKIKYFKKTPGKSSAGVENTEKTSENSKEKSNLVEENVEKEDSNKTIDNMKESDSNESNGDENDVLRKENDNELSTSVSNSNKSNIEVNEDKDRDTSFKDLLKCENESIDDNDRVLENDNHEEISDSCFNINSSNDETNIDNHSKNDIVDITENEPNVTISNETECLQENIDGIDKDINLKDKDINKDINGDKSNENEPKINNKIIEEHIDSNKDSSHNTKDDNTSSDDDDEPLLIRRKRKCTKKIVENHDVDKKTKKMEFKTFQCYVCFKLYQTKDELTTHCQEHFDICHSRTLSKCPLCDHVSYKGLAKHMRVTHDTELTTLHNSIRDNDGDGSGYSYNVNGTIIQVIPSVKALNKTASNKIDKDRREFKDKVVSKSKLVKKGNEWIVERETMPIEFDVIPELNDRELSKLKVTDTDVDRLQQLSYLAKKKGLKMMFPCFNCEKICQNFSGLKLHQRRHEVNPKPFKPRVKRNEKVVKDIKKIKLDKGNRNALPKPIVNKHKCDEKLKEFFESNIRGGDIEFWQFLKIYNRMNKEKVNDFKDLESRTDFGNHLDYYKDQSDGKGSSSDESSNLVTKKSKKKLKLD